MDAGPDHLATRPAAACHLGVGDTGADQGGRHVYRVRQSLREQNRAPGTPLRDLCQQHARLGACSVADHHRVAPVTDYRAHLGRGCGTGQQEDWTDRQLDDCARRLLHPRVVTLGENDSMVDRPGYPAARDLASRLTPGSAGSLVSSMRTRSICDDGHHYMHSRDVAREDNETRALAGRWTVPHHYAGAMTAASEPPSPRRGTQAIQRALGILWALADEGELSIIELANATGLTAGTAARMAKALAAEGMLRRNPATDAYHLGARTAVLGQAAQRVLGLDKARPAMEELGAATQESINLSIREGHESVVLLRVQSTLALRYEQTVGARFPLYSTSSGKAILAFSEDVDTFIAGLPERLPPVAPGTLATRRQLVEQLEEIRAQGYSTDIEENVEGVRCVGAPVLDEQGRARAALVLQAPAVRMNRHRMEELGQLLRPAASEIAHVIPDDRSLNT